MLTKEEIELQRKMENRVRKAKSAIWSIAQEASGNKLDGDFIRLHLEVAHDFLSDSLDTAGFWKPESKWSSAPPHAK